MYYSYVYINHYSYYSYVHRKGIAVLLPPMNTVLTCNNLQ